MITGTVNSELEARIQLSIHGMAGQEKTVDAVIDTGFNGYLTASPELIAALQLPEVGHAYVTFADGSESSCAVHRASIMWMGRLVDLDIESADTDTLVGMALMQGHNLHMRVEDGGQVLIQPIGT